MLPTGFLARMTDLDQRAQAMQRARDVPGLRLVLDEMSRFIRTYSGSEETGPPVGGRIELNQASG
jgi:hypothetical protein